MQTRPTSRPATRVLDRKTRPSALTPDTTARVARSSAAAIRAGQPHPERHDAELGASQDRQVVVGGEGVVRALGKVELLVERLAEGADAVQVQRQPHPEPAGVPRQLGAQVREVGQVADGDVLQVVRGLARVRLPSVSSERTSRQPVPNGRNRPLWASSTIESARSMPASRSRPRSVSWKKPP